jgi:hypothetical protein
MKLHDDVVKLTYEKASLDNQIANNMQHYLRFLKWIIIPIFLKCNIRGSVKIHDR